MTTQLNTPKKLKLLGNIGRVFFALAAAVYLFSFFSMLIHKVSGKPSPAFGFSQISETWYGDPPTPRPALGLVPHELACEVCASRVGAERVAVEPRTSSESWRLKISSILSALRLYLLPAAASILLYRIFSSFSRGAVFSDLVANCVMWLGIICVLHAFHYSFTLTEGGAAREGLPEMGVTHRSLMAFGIGKALLGLIFVSFGMAMRYGRQMED